MFALACLPYSKFFLGGLPGPLCHSSITENLTKCQLKKLWENPNPTSEITSLSVTLSSSDYDYLRVFYKGYINEDIMNSADFLKGFNCRLMWLEATGNAGTINYTYREIVRVSDTQLTIQNGTNIKYNSRTANSTECIPIAIYGGKFA